jgi:hypothetical protein
MHVHCWTANLIRCSLSIAKTQAGSGIRDCQVALCATPRIAHVCVRDGAVRLARNVVGAYPVHCLRRMGRVRESDPRSFPRLFATMQRHLVGVGAGQVEFAEIRLVQNNRGVPRRLALHSNVRVRLRRQRGSTPCISNTKTQSLHALAIFSSHRSILAPPLTIARYAHRGPPKCPLPVDEVQVAVAFVPGVAVEPLPVIREDGRVLARRREPARTLPRCERGADNGVTITS